VRMTGCSIFTDAEGAHGVDVTFGATGSVDRVVIDTYGSRSSAVSTDGTDASIHVRHSTVTAHAERSAGLYSTGIVEVADSRVTARADAGAVMDGHNAFVLRNTALHGETSGFLLWDTTGQTSESARGRVSVSGGSITTPGDAFDVPGSHQVIELSGVRVTNGDNVLDVAAGGGVNLSAGRTRLHGNVVADSTSAASVSLSQGSSLTGTVQNSALSLGRGTVWTVTADSVLTSLSIGAGTRDDQVDSIIGNGHTVTYDAALPANAALGGKTYRLRGGGILTPAA
jgi:hypothetical protein